MNDERARKIAWAKKCILNNEYALKFEVPDVSFAEVDRLERLIRDDKELLDRLDDNDKLIEIIGEESHDMYKSLRPELRQSTKIVEGVSGSLFVFEPRLIYTLDGTYLKEYKAPYVEYAGGGVRIWIAFVVEMNMLYWWKR